MREVLTVERDARGVVRFTLNRPEAHNALSPELTEALERAVDALGADAALRTLVVTGAGESFCAGGDIKSMRAMVAGTREARMARSTRFARLLAAIRALPVPVLARVHGPAYAGGAGLVSVADIAIASDGARFGFTEPRIGIAPANISPYVLARIGVTAARRLFLTARRFEAAEGLRLGLYDRVVAADALDAAIDAELEAILQCSPSALAACKRLIAEVPGKSEEAAMAYTARLLAELWETDDAREGIAAFNEKRKPRWTKTD
ncbi:MAG: enoyl-CoA hydratase-related protein [Burkholderiales bacterium]|nr:enoyl-CoA hydratase-related protein [Burkholderiales bacterium]